MIAALTIAMMLRQEPEAPTPGAIVSRMLAYYHDAKSMTGGITMIQSAMGKSISVETTLQFERPSKIFLKQVRNSSDPRQWLVTSDGKFFSYDVPNEMRDRPNMPDKRLVERVETPTKSLTVDDIYKAAADSLGDRSAALDIVIGRLEDLKFLRNQWATVTNSGKQKIGQIEADVIKGGWREYGNAPVSGKYEMWIGADGQLLRYVYSEIVSIKAPDGQQLSPQEIVTTWDMHLKKDGEPDSKLFQVIR